MLYEGLIMKQSKLAAVAADRISRVSEDVILLLTSKLPSLRDVIDNLDLVDKLKQVSMNSDARSGISQRWSSMVRVAVLLSTFFRVRRAFQERSILTSDS